MIEPTGEFCTNCVGMIPTEQLRDHPGDGLCQECRANALRTEKAVSAVHRMTNVDLANRIVALRAALREIATGGVRMPETHIGVLAHEIGRVRRVAAQALAVEGISLPAG